MNLLALGVRDVRTFGVIGADPWGQEMLRLLRGGQVGVGGMLAQAEDWSTHVYVKPYAGDREESRIDFGNFNRLQDATASELVRRLEAELPAVDLVIVNEQVHSMFFQQELGGLIRRHAGMLFLLDSRHYSDVYDGALRKLNDHEAARLCGVVRPAGDLVLYSEARQAARDLQQRWQKPVVVTRGARGCLVAERGDVHEIPGLQILGRIDPVGAGDSMLAGLAAALGAGRPPVVAATLGNFVAGVTVQKLFQTGTATPGEIMAIGSDPDYVYRPELAEDPRGARFLEGTDFEVITALPAAAGFTHAIFDHDGTLSTVRQGWERIMEPMMIRAVLGDRFEGADESLYQKVVRRVREFIDKTTGVQTITQMEGLVAMVREFACVPDDRVLDPAGYKAIYNQELMALVLDRIGRLERGELAVEDFTLKNAVLLLRALRRAGIPLYLASGTDRDDVVREAGALGYADAFEGRIYGSAGTSGHEAKREVLERILRDIGAGNAQRLITLGDGPVEIRETHKLGGYAVGVASDEIRRFGANTEKRARLIRAGADMIVPDFSQLQPLLRIIGVAR